MFRPPTVTIFRDVLVEGYTVLQRTSKPIYIYIILRFKQRFKTHGEAGRHTTTTILGW
jgi:hypothetical protein